MLNGINLTNLTKIENILSVEGCLSHYISVRLSVHSFCYPAIVDADVYTKLSYITVVCSTGPSATTSVRPSNFPNITPVVSKLYSLLTVITTGRYKEVLSFSVPQKYKDQDAGISSFTQYYEDFGNCEEDEDEDEETKCYGFNF